MAPLRRVLSALALTALRRAGAQDADGAPTPSLAERALGPEFEEHGGNPCKGEADGWKCHNDEVLQCSGGRTEAHEACAFYQECKEDVGGLGTASCEEDACEDKPDGFHCHDNRVVECSGLKTVSFTECPFYQVCKRDTLQLNMASCQEDECDEKADGLYCEDSHVVECRNFVMVNATTCGSLEQCSESELDTPAAACVQECVGKADGKYCEHDGVLSCLGGKVADFSRCPFYQECSENGPIAGAITASCQEDACEDSAEGWKCRGDHLVQCAGLVTVDVEACPSHQQCEEQSDGTAPACM